MSTRKNSSKAQSLLEVLLALGMLLIFMSGAITLSFKYLDNYIRTSELGETNMIATETFEAIQNAAYGSWDTLSDGTHGLDKSSGQWQLNATPDLINSKYTRTLTISTAQRDIDCNLVDSDGTSDSDTKLVSLNISWNQNGHMRQENFSQYYTKWQNPTNCLVATEEDEDAGPGGQAGGLSLNTETANRNEFFNWINLLVNINDVKVKNTHDHAVTINKVQIFFDQPGMTIYSFLINDSRRWGMYGPGTPSGNKVSGTTLDIVNYTINPGQTIDIDMKFFSSTSGSIKFKINFIMEDETEISTNEFTL